MPTQLYGPKGLLISDLVTFWPAYLFTIPLGISSIKLGGYPPDKSIFLYTFLGLGCTTQFYSFFFGVRTGLYSDVHLPGDSHVQRRRFRFFKDHILWKAAIFQRHGFQFYSGWGCYHPKKHTSPYHTIPYPIPISSKSNLYNWESL